MSAKCDAVPAAPPRLRVERLERLDDFAMDLRMTVNVPFLAM